MALSKVNPNFVNQNVGRRNILRNGDMRIAQANSSTVITATTTQYVVDRIKHNLAGSTGARYSVQ